MELATKRIRIRKIESEDAEALHKIIGDTSIAMMMFLPKKSLEETKEFVAQALEEWGKKEPEDYEYVILYQDSIIGSMNLEAVGEKEYEIGWIISKDYRRQGFAYEAAALLMEYAFTEMKAASVRAHCDTRNTVSEHLMQKLGMLCIWHDGIRIYPKTNEHSKECLYRITREEYTMESTR